MPAEKYLTISALIHYTKDFYNFMINLEKEMKKILATMDLFIEKAKVNQKKIVIHLKTSKITVSREELKGTFVEDKKMAVLLGWLLHEYTTFRVFANTNKVIERYKLKKKLHSRKKSE